jgi:membrane protease YdiL (CAAX protease family)
VNSSEGGEATPGGRAGRWKVIHAVAAFAAGVVASVVGYLAVAPGGVSTFEALAVVGGAQTVVTIAVVWMLARPVGREPLGLRMAPVDAGGLILGAALEIGLTWATYVVIRALFGGEAPVQGVVRVASEAHGALAQAAVLVVTVILAPVSEELVFRGILLRALQSRFGARWALVGSAVAFALVHLALDPSALAAVPALFVVGLVLAAQVQRSGRLGPALATHAGFNLIGVLALLYLQGVALAG